MHTHMRRPRNRSLLLRRRLLRRASRDSGGGGMSSSICCPRHGSRCVLFSANHPPTPLFLSAHRFRLQLTLPSTRNSVTHPPFCSSHTGLVPAGPSPGECQQWPFGLRPRAPRHQAAACGPVRPPQGDLGHPPRHAPAPAQGGHAADPHRGVADLEQSQGLRGGRCLHRVSAGAV